MAKLSDSDIIHISKLSNLTLTAPEIAKFKKQLSEVLSYIQELSEVDVATVEPTSQTTGLENALRDDAAISECLTVSEAVAGSENIHNNYFLVPLTLKERTL